MNFLKVKKSALVSALLLLAPFSAGSSGTFGPGNSVEVKEVWWGTTGTPSSGAVCTDTGYVETTQLKHTSSDGQTSITYRGTGCDADASSPNNNHFTLAPGVYRISVNATYRIGYTGTVQCNAEIYSEVDDYEAVLVSTLANPSTGHGGDSVIKWVRDGTTFSIVPYYLTCATITTSQVEITLLIERLNL